MCGIAGIANFSGIPIDPDQLVSSTRTLTHRGPDEEGYYINTDEKEMLRPEYSSLPLRRSAGDGHIGLGHRRLSIIDLASGQQPLSNEDKTVWISFNGEIYNYQGLKRALEEEGHVFRTNSDTETLVHAYEQWGERFVEKLRGMFAFAIWDEKKKTLFIARDRLGKKPVYYYFQNRTFVFASELKAVLQAGNIDRELDYTALSDYFSFLYVPSPKTIFKHIKKLPAAHYAVVTADGIRVEEYWDLTFDIKTEQPENRTIDDLNGILEEATRIRMMSEVPLGAFLSGGVDSSAVVAMMSQGQTDPVITNSISFNVDQYNEAPFARKVSDLFGTRHFEFNVVPEALPVIEKLAWHYDEPFADSSAVPTYYVSKMARERVTVSLSGDGGDENFAGYQRYYMDKRENLVRNAFPAFLRPSVFKLIRQIYDLGDSHRKNIRGKAFFSNVFRSPVDAYYHTVSAVKDTDKSQFFNTRILKELNGYQSADLFRKIYADAPADDHLSRIQYLDIKTYLCEDILTKVDRASMAVSLEVRCPVLDHIFMEYAATLPPGIKLKGFEGKYIFKKALKKYLPDEILYRKKMGFAVPILEWMKSDLKAFTASLVLEGQASLNYLNIPYLQEIWSEHQSGRQNWSVVLWTVMMFNLWHRNFIE